MRSVFVDFATVSAGDLDTAALDRVLPGMEYFPLTAPGELAGRIRGAGVVLTNKARLDAQAQAAAGGLRLILLSATGTDNVDLAAARAAGTAVCNIRGYCTASVVQHVFAMILSLTQRLADYHAAVRAGAWGASAQFSLLDFPIRELAGRTLGIVGYGELGRAVARAGEAFGMRIAVAARRGAPAQAGRVPFDELLAAADVLSLHCPLTPETRELIGARELARMQPDALLVNTARGGLVDAAALAVALRAGRLGGAGIDVLAQEPPVDGNPLLAPDLARLVVTPHVAWAAREARQRALDEMAENAAAFLRGERRNRVV
jgi:glycerate dehydrogenase